MAKEKVLSQIGVEILKEEIEKIISGSLGNPNLLDNPDFRINQRGASETVTQTGYFVDRWLLESGTVTVNADGTLTLDGTIKQRLESTPNGTVTASSSAGTAAYDSAENAFTLTASGENIAWAKLEIGGSATPFSTPDPATERVKCLSYFQRYKNSGNKYVFFGSGYAYSATKGFGFIPLIAPLKDAAYTVVLNGTVYCANAEKIGSSSVLVSEISNFDASCGAGTMGFSFTAEGLTINTPVLFQFRDTTSYIDISADL